VTALQSLPPVPDPSIPPDPKIYGAWRYSPSSRWVTRQQDVGARDDVRVFGLPAWTMRPRGSGLGSVQGKAWMLAGGTWRWRIGRGSRTARTYRTLAKGDESTRERACAAALVACDQWVGKPAPLPVLTVASIIIEAGKPVGGLAYIEWVPIAGGEAGRAVGTLRVVHSDGTIEDPKCEACSPRDAWMTALEKWGGKESTDRYGYREQTRGSPWFLRPCTKRESAERDGKDMP
jgi:hypothetical protein